MCGQRTVSCLGWKPEPIGNRIHGEKLVQHVSDSHLITPVAHRVSQAMYHFSMDPNVVILACFDMRHGHCSFEACDLSSLAVLEMFTV